MHTEQLISPAVPTLMLTDTGEKALLLMEQNHFTQLPLVNDEQYIGLVNENVLLEWEAPESPLSAGEFANYKPAVFASGHPYEALRMAAHRLSDMDCFLGPTDPLG